MPNRSVIIHGTSDSPQWGSPPSAPQKVTSTTKDAGATVSWYAPASQGSSGITHYIVTPWIGATPQSATTVPVASLTSLSDSYGGTALQTIINGLTNGTAYTFTVQARNSNGDSIASAASGANTPFANLLFGDDFNGPAGAAPDPEWWVYDRCGYLAQSEVQWYKPSHCVLDGSSHLEVKAEYINTTGPRYPSDPQYPGNITQPWRSGACQSNTRLYTPTTGNTIRFEANFKVNAGAGNGYWPGFFWLEGQTYIQQWKTDPQQEGWDDAGKAEIDVAEWYQTGGANNYGMVSWAGSNTITNSSDATDLATAFHTYRCDWKPGASCKFFRDDVQKANHTTQVPSSGAQFFLMIYMQMLAGGSTQTQSAFVDWVRVYEVNT